MKQAGFVPIIILVGLVILLIILFAPLPYYERGGCALTYPRTRCISEGWRLGTPLYKRFFVNTTQSSAIIPKPTSVDVNPELAGSAETANSDSTGANWKTYRSSKLGIEFQYPSEYSVDEGLGSGVVALRVPWRPKGQVLDVWIHFYRFTLFPKGDLHPCGEKEELVYDLRSTNCYKDILIGGVNGIKYALGGDYIVTVEKPELQIKIDGAIISRFSGGEKVDKILSSFKFYNR